MKIAIYGMGYVGCVSGACLAELGHDIIGVDINQNKLELIEKGESPIIEPGLDKLIKKGIQSGKLTTSSNPEGATKQTEVSIVCVGTPSRINGSLETQYIERVLEQIGGALKESDAWHVIVIRSTMLPTIFRSQLIPLLEKASGKKAGEGFGLCVNPEFLREGSAIEDFMSPPFTVIGGMDERSGKAVEAIYEKLPGKVFHLEPEGAAMVKYASNAFHALKVVFGNEIGAMCNELEINSHKVMEVFVEDKQLNISPTYLRPGFAFGGSCLPKDVRALQYIAKHRDINIPMLSSLLPSNGEHIQRALDVVFQHGKRNIALLGLSFKPGTDDLRESPQVSIAEALIGKGYGLSIFDEEVSLSNIFGRNREYIEQVLPHIHKVLRTDLENIVKEADVIIVGKKFNHLEKIQSLLREDQLVLDLIKSGDWRPARHTTLV